MIKVTINHEQLSLINFLVDESKHHSINQVLSDLADQFNFRRDKLERIVSRSGKRIKRVEEFFLTKDDRFVAFLASYNPYVSPYAQQNQPSYSSYDQMNKVRAYYDNPYFRSVMIETNGQSHVFDPPATDYYDQIYRKSTDTQERLHLEWIYGYNGKKCRNNIILLPSEEILYFVAKVAVILNDAQQQQRFYTEHNDEIRSVAQHPNQWIVATGQITGGSEEEISHVRIWDSKILVTLNVLEFDMLNASVECMAFGESDNGVRLATVTAANSEWCLTVWDWEESVKVSISETYDDESAELDIKFDPRNHNNLVTCGKEHVFFWDISQHDAIYQLGYFEDYDNPEYVTCLGYDMNGRLISGDSNGVVHVWDVREKRTSSMIQTVHTGSIITLQVLFGNHILTGGGSDRKLTLINCNEMISTESELELPEPLGGVVAMNPMLKGFNGGEQNFDYLRMILGTSSNCILRGSMNEGFECIMRGVSGDLPAVCIHPSENMFITAGSDSLITAWSTQSKTDVWEIKQDHPCSSADYNSTGNVVAIGTTIGRWFVYNANNGQQVASFQCDRSTVTCIKYSPSGDYVAVGMESGIVFFYKIHEELDYKYVFSNKLSRDEIISIDWSTDGRIVRLVNNKYDVFYWNVHYRRIEGNRNIIKDIQLETETTPMNYQTSGVWIDNEADITFKTTDRSQTNTAFLAGVNNGSVRLYPYPCDVESTTYYNQIYGEAFQEVDIHSSAVSKVAFLLNGQSALTSGLKDCCIAQWKVVSETPMLKNDPTPFQPQYTVGSLSASTYLKTKPDGSLRMGPSPRSMKVEGDGSLSQPHLSKRESLQSQLMRKSHSKK